MTALQEKSEDHSDHRVITIHPEGNMNIPKFMEIYKVVDEIFNSKPQMSSSWWHQRKSQDITKINRIHPLGTMIWANPCSDISVWTTDQNCNKNTFCFCWES